ncbi:hypothetical protein [Thermodesulfitimonas sp.]|jgi:hypothetical protein
MSVDRLVEEFKKLTPREQKELLRRLSAFVTVRKKRARGEEDPLAAIIGIFDGPGTGSTTYKEDLYGGARPL